MKNKEKDKELYKFKKYCISVSSFNYTFIKNDDFFLHNEQIFSYIEKYVFLHKIGNEFYQLSF